MRNSLVTLSVCLVLLSCCSEPTFGQAHDFTAVRAGVAFDRTLRDWDGFGFNYVETAHSYDMKKFNQEYGGFSLLDEVEKREIIDLVFGEEGLRVGIVKMFLGANHQQEPNGPYDHESTTSNMRYFVKQGLKVTRRRGGDLKIITTLYGPPGFMTLQKADRGRDLDPAYKEQLALYMIDWVKYLKKEERLPVKYLSLHNEGEDWHRWNKEGFTENAKHDYNLYWPPEQINEFVKMMPPLLKKHGFADVGITNGEPSNWYRFSAWGLAHALANDKEAVESLGLITSHGFYRGVYGAWFGEHNSIANDLLRAQRPELHSWVTSTSWAEMDVEFIKQIHGNIYTSKVNAINQNVIHTRFVMTVNGETVYVGNGMIGWTADKKQIVGSSFNSTGGYGNVVYTIVDEKTFLGAGRDVSPNGDVTEDTTTVKRVGEDTVTFTKTDIVAGGEKQPDEPPLEFERVKK